MIKCDATSRQGTINHNIIHDTETKTIQGNTRHYLKKKKLERTRQNMIQRRYEYYYLIL